MQRQAKSKRSSFTFRLREAFFHSRLVANFYPDFNNTQDRILRRPFQAQIFSRIMKFYLILGSPELNFRYTLQYRETKLECNWKQPNEVISDEDSMKSSQIY